MKISIQIVLTVLLVISAGSNSFSQIQKNPTIANEADVDNSTYTGVIIEHFANGSPSLWKNMVNGKAEGLWLEWYPNGNLRYRAYWKNNLGHGRWEYFYPNGQLRSESFYIDDITQGIFKAYHENGQLRYDATFIDGNKVGVELTYDVNGQLISRIRYENGVRCIDEPLIFEEGNISDKNGNEWGINFTPDGKTAYFTRRDLATNKKRIYITTKTETGWSNPTIAPFSIHEDETPFISNDGNKLYFASYRPLPGNTSSTQTDMNIWEMHKTDNGWSAPKPLTGVINKTMTIEGMWPANYEAGPITDAKGNLYYWTKGTMSNATNIYMSPIKNNGTFGNPQELMPPSSHNNYDSSPQLSPDGNILFFCSDDRPGSYGGSDLYYSIQKDGQWSSPKNLGPIVNSSQSESFPSFSPDGKYFYFSSNRGDQKDTNGERIWNLYYMETKYLMLED